MNRTEISMYGVVPEIHTAVPKAAFNKEQALYEPEPNSVVILRQEPSSYIFESVRANMRLQQGKHDQIFEDVWQDTCTEVVQVLKWAYQSDESTRNSVLHIWKMDQLLPGIEKKLDGKAAVCTDPLLDKQPGMIPFGISRKFQPGGRIKDNHTHRPGYEPAQEQVQRIAQEQEKLRKQLGKDFRLEVIEDDYYTGASLQRILTQLKSGGVPISSVIASFYLGKEMDLPVDKVEGVVRYDPDSNKDLEDFRDFAPFGSNGGGLVIYNPHNGIRPTVNGSHGDIYGLMRAPYVYPFVDPHARANIPDSAAIAFSRKLIDINRQAYQELGGQLGKPVELGHVDPYFGRLIDHYYGLPKNTPMQEVCNTMNRRFDSTMEEIFGADQTAK